MSSNAVPIRDPGDRSRTLDTWYEIELPFATAGYKNPAGTLPDFTNVVGIGFQLKAVTAGTLPVETTMYVDDVWLE